MIKTVCDEHPGEHDAFAVCKHITCGVARAQFVDVTATPVPVIVCADCQSRSRTLSAADMVIACRAHVEELGWLCVNRVS